MVDLVTAAADAILGDLSAPYAAIFTPSHYMGSVFPDVTLAENHTDVSVITQHPVQGGSPVSDHYYDTPPQLEIRAGYSDSSGGYTGYVNDMYAAILAQRATREPFTVSTGLRQYDNMLFGQINVTRDADTDNVCLFTAALQQVNITSVDSSGAGSSNQADPSSTSSSVDSGNKSLQTTQGVSGGTDSETAASAQTGGGYNPVSAAGSETAASAASGVSGYSVTNIGNSAVSLPGQTVTTTG